MPFTIIMGDGKGFGVKKNNTLNEMAALQSCLEEAMQLAEGLNLDYTAEFIDVARSVCVREDRFDVETTCHTNTVLPLPTRLS